MPARRCACFGPDAAAYRVESYPAYHAHRPPVPDDLAHQFALAPGLFRALGWGVSVTDVLEADDVMGALAGSRGGGRRIRPGAHRRPGHVPGGHEAA